MLLDRTAGDPMRQDVRWTDLTDEHIAEHLAEAGTPVSVPVVKQLLKKHHYVTRKAQKTKAMGGHPDRDQQFENIARLKREYLGTDDPIVSMDTKKKELIGNFYRAGHLLSSTSAVISRSDEASLLGAMRDMYTTLHRTQGGCHDHFTRSASQTTLPETNPRAASRSAAPTGA